MSVSNTFKESEFREERDALSLISIQLNNLEHQYPDWWAQFDNVSPDWATRAEVAELMASAPNPFALGVLYGKYTMRMEIAAMTKREWA